MVSDFMSQSGITFEFFVNDPQANIPEVKKVIWNNNACIVLWKDDTKTVVKCQEGDVWNNEVGLMAAFSKKLFGNDNTFNKVINKYCSPFFNKDERIQTGLEKLDKRFSMVFEDEDERVTILTRPIYLSGRYDLVFLRRGFGSGIRRQLPQYANEFLALAEKHFKADMDECNVELSVVETKDNTFKIVLVEKKGEEDEVQE